MRETRSNNHQILSDGRTVWVNGPKGESVARVSRFGAKVGIDIHNPIDVQKVHGIQCLDCRHDMMVGPAAWEYFDRAVSQHFCVTIDDVHRPDWARCAAP